MPGRKAIEIVLSEKQKSLLEAMVRAKNTAQSVALRAAIILKSGEGQKNKDIACQLKIDVQTARLWRWRWSIGQLTEVEKGLTEKQLKACIEKILSDEARCGKPPDFEATQVVQIVALACEDVEKCGYPVSHWTPELLALESCKRGIVTRISGSSVRRFLKGSPFTTPSGTLLAASTPRKHRRICLESPSSV